MTDESVFAAALAIPSPAARAAYLDRACAGKPDVRAEVEALLAAHAVSNPLDHPPADLGATGGYDGGDSPPAAEVGDRVGPYRLMEQIGEGGMGLVFVAEQTEPVRRKVAVKVIKPGMDTRQVVARFEAERQALALMDHPHIAKVLDAGATPEGRPYFVMELVRGLPITDYCDQQKLPPAARLALFVQVCQAVQHAHQKGVIHRDIKPSNVLVAPHDGVPVVKVIDFGVAKAVGQSLTDKTIYTRFAQMIGTPLYMSPEQAEVNQLDVDTRADVYALGVLLYELLTGTTPFDGDRFRKAAFDEIRRILREEDPPKPSTRLTSLGATLTGVSARRGTDPGRLAGLVRGELDWIVMRCLEKDRNRRYDTAAGLAKDVQRHLSGDAVEACPPTLGYRVGKFLQKNKAAVRVGSAFVCMGVGAVAMGAYLAVQAKRAEQAAEVERVAAVGARNAEADRRAEAERLGDDLRRANYQASIRLAAASVERGQVGVARELLDRTRPAPGQTDLRGFEWHYLRRQLDTESETIRDPHPGLVPEDCAYSPDGRYLAVTSGSHLGSTSPAVLWLWDMAEKRVRWSVTLSGYSAGNLEFTPDGARLMLTVFLAGAPGSGSVSEVWLYDAERGTPQRLTRLNDEYAYALAASPDSRRLAVLRKSATASRVRGITTYDVAAGTPLATVSAPDGTQDGHLGFDAAGRLLAVWVGEGVVTLRDCDAGTVRATLDLRPLAADVRDVRLGARCTRLAVGTADRQVRVWDLAGAAPDLQSMFPVDSIGLSSQLHLSPDGRFASMSNGIYGSVVTVWEVRTGRQVLVGRGHTESVGSHAFAPDGRSAASPSYDGTVKVWRLPPPREPGSDLIASNRNADVVARPDGGFSAVAISRDGNAYWLQVVDVATGGGLMPPMALPGSSQSMVGPEFKLSPDGRWALNASATARDRYHVTEVATGRRAPGTPAVGIAIARGKFLTADVALVESPDRVWQLWDVATGRRSPSPYGDVVLPHIAASRDGRRVAVVRKDWSVRVLDATTGAEVRAIAAPGPGGSRPTLSGDGTRLVLVGRNEAIVYDLETGTERRLRGHSAGLRVALLSPDGRRVFTAAQDLTLKVWDAETGLELLSIHGEGEIRAAAVSPDGHRLAVQYWQNGRGEIFDATPLAEPQK